MSDATVTTAGTTVDAALAVEDLEVVYTVRGVDRAVLRGVCPLVLRRVCASLGLQVR